MKRNNILGVILCLLVTTNLFAQEYNTYDLNKYYTPDIVRSGLDLYFNTSGELNNQINNFTNFSANNDTVNVNNLSGQLNSNFFTYKNTRKHLSLLDIQLFLSSHFDNDNQRPLRNYIQNEHNENFSEYLNVFYSNRFYKSTKRFMSYGISTDLNFSNFKYNTKDFNLNEVTRTYDHFYSSITPYIGCGIGRIESVKDARQAIYILDDLSKRGVLTRNLSSDEIFKFAQIISQVKNKRFLDSRLRKIEEISAVDSFLVNNQLLSKTDAIYFTSLYDNWENGANFNRQSGRIFEIQLSPTANWESTEYRNVVLNGANSWDNNRFNIYGVDLTLYYNYTKQINLKWEKGVNTSLICTIKRKININEAYDINEITDKTNIGSFTLNGNFYFGFYPNTRTNLSAKLSQSFGQEYNKMITNNYWYNSFSSYTSFESNAVYYISQNLSLTGSATVVNRYNTYLSANNGNMYNQIGVKFSASLKYSFF